MSAAYLARRALAIPITILGASLLIFIVMRVVPGDVARVILSESGNIYTQEDLNELRQEMGLDRPLYLQYADWLQGIFTGDVGDSLVTGRPVMSEIGGRFEITFELATLALLFSLAIGIPLGVLAAIGHDRWWAHISNFVGIVGLAVPGFWLGTMTILLLVTQFHWVPRATYVPIWEDPVANLSQFFFPAITLALGSSAIIMRLTRSSVIEAMTQDYVRTARSKGLQPRAVTVRHILRNALLPITTLIGLQIATLIGGSVVIENVYNLPGLGRLVTQSVNERDYPIVQAIVLYFALIQVLVWFILDILYARLDPRVSF